LTSRSAKSFDRVRRFGLAMPDVEEGTAWGVPALRYGGRIICCTAAHKDAEPNSLVVMLPFDQRDALVDEAPDTYYLKPHYVGHPCVLVRLGRVRDDALRDLLFSAQRFVSDSGKRRPLKPSARRTARRRTRRA
jgi:hypothetical protein